MYKGAWEAQESMALEKLAWDWAAWVLCSLCMSLDRLIGLYVSLSPAVQWV